MKRFKIKYFFLSILSGILLALSFQKVNAFYFAWISLIPIIYTSLRNSVRNSLIYGFIFGMVSYSISLFWMYPFLEFNTNNWQAMICSFLLWAYLAFYFSLWSGMLSFSRRHFHPLFSSFYAASAWVTLEFIRTYIFTGFSWNLLGYSQATFLYIIQIADITSVYGVSFIIVFINMLLFYWLKDSKENKFLKIIIFILLACLIYGHIKIKKYSQPYGDKITVGVVQPNIDQYKKWDEKYKNDILDNIKLSVAELENKELDLVVYPETLLPGYLEYEPQIANFVSEISKIANLNLVCGVSYDTKHLYNSVFAITKDSTILGIHNKLHLVVFGEYIPFKKLLSKYFGVLNSLGDFTKGKYANVFEYKNLSIGSTICSENFFPNIARRFVLRGAHILTNHTNDAWFFDSFAPYQHFVMNIFRAVENRKNVIVSANTGISAVIDSAGNVVKSTNINETIAFVSDAYQNSDISVYTKMGYMFCYFCIFITMFVLVIIFLI